MKASPVLRRALLGSFLLFHFALPLAALELHRERALPTDLAVTGKLVGVPAGETRYVG